MSNLLFSLNATIPLFLLIALGFCLKKAGILSEGFLKSANSFNFKVTLPVLLFTDLAACDLTETFDLRFLLFCMAVTTAAFGLIWLIAAFVIKDRQEIAEFVQASYRSSAAVMGIALIINLYGETGMGGMMILGCVPLYNIYAVCILSFYSPLKKEGVSPIKNALVGIAKNPIIIAIILGLISSLIGIDYPDIIDTTLGFISRIATPLALICIGGNFSFKNAKKYAGKSIAAACIKIILLPAVFTTVAILMGFNKEQLVAIFIMLAAPSTPSCFIMAKQYGYGGDITSGTVVMTTLFSAVTLTVFIYILRTLGYI